MMNILYLPIVAIISFGIGFIIISIPGIRNSLKKTNKRFSDKELQKLTNYRNANFASTNEEYSHVPENLD